MNRSECVATFNVVPTGITWSRLDRLTTAPTTKLFLFLGLLVTLGLMMTSGSVAAADADRQLYEVRRYVQGENSDPAAIDSYLQDALLPALQRQGIDTVGVFSASPADETGVKQIVVAIAYANAAEMLGVKQKLATDESYNQAAAEYLARGPKEPPFSRISSELLVAMDCWPSAKVPEDALANNERVYELRLYESPTERVGDVKVEMFNAGEVPIFLDCGIIPIFIGQAVIGPNTPSLTYLTMYPNEAARIESWKAFRAHPDWKILSAEKKYEGTVNRIDKYVLVPKSYSKM